MKKSIISTIICSFLNLLCFPLFWILEEQLGLVDKILDGKKLPFGNIFEFLKPWKHLGVLPDGKSSYMQAVCIYIAIIFIWVLIVNIFTFVKGFSLHKEISETHVSEHKKAGAWYKAVFIIPICLNTGILIHFPIAFYQYYLSDISIQLICMIVGLFLYLCMIIRTYITEDENIQKGIYRGWMACSECEYFVKGENKRERKLIESKTESWEYSDVVGTIKTEGGKTLMDIYGRKERSALVETYRKSRWREYYCSRCNRTWKENYREDYDYKHTYLD